jgi:hypothetical protein
LLGLLLLLSAHSAHRPSELTHWGHLRLRLVELALWWTSELPHLRLATHHSTHLPTEQPHH